MITESSGTELKPKVSKFGLASLIIGLLNITISIFYFIEFVLWVSKKPDILENPGVIDGMQVPSTILDVINLLIVLSFCGIICGIVDIIKIKKSNLIAVSGIILNGLLLSFALWKVG